MTAALRLEGRNGVERKPRARGKAKPPARAGKGWAVKAVTVGMGIGIPGLSLALSSAGGQLCRAGHYGLGVAFMGLCGVVLAVSLSHLAWAIGYLTRSATWARWCLALACDLGIVASEIALVAAPGTADGLIGGIMLGVTVASMFLNCVAFLREGR